MVSRAEAGRPSPARRPRPELQSAVGRDVAPNAPDESGEPRTGDVEVVVIDGGVLARIDELEGDRALVALDGLPEEQRPAVHGSMLDERDYRP